MKAKSTGGQAADGGVRVAFHHRDERLEACGLDVAAGGGDAAGGVLERCQFAAGLLEGDLDYVAGPYGLGKQAEHPAVDDRD